MLAYWHTPCCRQHHADTIHTLVDAPRTHQAQAAPPPSGCGGGVAGCGGDVAGELQRGFAALRADLAAFAAAGASGAGGSPVRGDGDAGGDGSSDWGGLSGIEIPTGPAVKGGGGERGERETSSESATRHIPL